MAAAIPNDWLCPITLHFMRDPVIAEDGHSYERSAITEWLQHNNTSPKTNLRLRSTNLVPNIALRNTIQDYFAKNPSASTLATQSAYKDSPLKMTATKSDTHIHLRVEATDAPIRKPIDIIAIVDTSGSMGEVADTEAPESFGYTRADLVKHTIRTMVSVLHPQDTLAIVSYSTSARVVIRPTPVTAEGRALLSAAIDTLDPDSQTNIYDGIRQAAMLANSPEMAGRNVVALLLTDGFPNVNPPRGIIPTLQSMEMKNRWSLHTFGFGYKLDSALLAEIAHWGNGLFGFIPDCSMVATIFINFLSNMLCTASANATITMSTGGGGGDSVFQTGPVLYGQPRDFVFPLAGFAPICKLNGEVVECSSVDSIDSFADARSQYIVALDTSIKKARAMKYVDALLSLETVFMSLQSNTTPAKEFMRDIHGLDPEGQVGMAPTEAYFVKWGEHYLRSYVRAQQLQQCMNFKDPGLQIYGGTLFHENQTAADKAFDALPAPQPSGRPVRATAGPAYTPTSLTATFNNPSGGCFSGETRVLMADESMKAIKDIEPGELVWTPNGPATVTALVTCNTSAKSQPLCRIGDGAITPWHPILVPVMPRENSPTGWKFPATLYMYSERMVQTVYNLVLTNGHIVNAGGVLACTLAHGFTGPVIGHDFFGTNKVIHALMRLDGWEKGRPTFTNLVAVKDPVTNMITDWRDVV